MASGPQFGGAGSHVGGAKAYFRVRGTDTAAFRVEGKLVSDAQKLMAAENKELAFVAQSRVIRYTVNNYKRPGVSSGRLEAVTAMDWNRIASAYYIGIGNIKKLDNSVAKYWRTIEEGSAATWKKRSFRSLELTGVFGATLAGPRRAGGPFSLPQRNPRVKGKFVPIRPDWKGTAWFGKTPLRPFNPRHEIEPKHAYRRVYDEGHFTMGAVHAARNHIRRIMAGSGAIIAGTDFKPPAV